MEKFKVGQKVYCIRRGLGEVSQRDKYLQPRGGYCDFILVAFPDKDSAEFSSDGKLYDSDKNPTLLTLEEARAKGYDVPKQRIIKEKTVYINLYGDGERSYIHDTEESAKYNARIGDSKLLATAYPVTIKYEVEE